MKNGIPHRNHKPYGWWIASYIERAAQDDEPNPAPNGRCLAWENTIILQDTDSEAAYEKTVSLATQISSEFEDDTRSGRTGHWVFEGISSLLAIHDELKDGAEILWGEHRNRTVRKIRSLVKKKNELETFDDTPPISDGV